MPTGKRDWRQAFRRHERGIAVAWLVAAGLFLVAFALPGPRVPALAVIERGVDWWDTRWTRRVEHGEALLDAGRFEEASVYLTRLDSIFPATHVKHARDKQREHLLQLLGRANEAAAHRSRAMDAWTRLYAFDSLNYRNRYAYGAAGERLLSGWAIADEARDGYAAALRIFPSHLPAVRGYIDYYMDRGEYPPIVAEYREYLDAHLVQPIEVRVADVVVTVPLLVDGWFHDVEVPLAHPGGDGLTLTIATGGFSLALEGASLVPALVAGQPGASVPIALDLAGLRPTGAEPAEHGAYRGLDETTRLDLPIPGSAPAVAGLRVRIALYKPLDLTLWRMVVKSYRNLLDPAGLDSAAARTVTLPDADMADQVLARLQWAREGLGAMPGEQPN